MDKEGRVHTVLYTGFKNFTVSLETREKPDMAKGKFLL
jgi:hypothetical protein